MAAKVGGVIIGLRADTAQFERDMGKADQVLAKNASRMDARMKSLEKTFATAGKVMGTALAAGLTVAAYQLTNAVNRMKELADTATQVGVSVEKLQEFRYAAAKFGVDAATADAAIRKLQESVGQATQETGALYDITQQYGIAVRDVTGRTRPLMDIYGDLADAAKNSGDATEAARIAAAAMGEEGARLGVLLREGEDGFTNMATAARDAGEIVSAANIEAAANIKREYDEMFRYLDAKWMQWAVSIGNGIREAGKLLNIVPPTLAEQIDQKRSSLAVLEGNQPFVSDSVLQSRRAELAALERQQLGGLYSNALAGAGARMSAPPPAPIPRARTPRTGRSAGASDLDRFNEDLDATLFEMQADNLQALTDEIEAQWQPTMDLIAAHAEHIEALYEDAEAVKDMLDPMREYQRQADRLNEMYRVGALTLPELNAAMAKMAEKAREAGEAMETAFNRSIDAVRQMVGDPLIDALMGEKKPGDAAKEALKSIQRGVLETALYGRNTSLGGLFGNEFSGVMEGLLPHRNGSVSVWVENQPTPALASGGRGGFLSQFLKMITGGLLGGGGFSPDVGGVSLNTQAMLDVAFLPIFHDGLYPGAPAPPMQMVPSALLDGAPRLHLGLAPDEFPAILQEGEEVIPRGGRRRGGGGVTINFNGPTDADSVRRSMGQIESGVARAVHRGMRNA